MIPSYYGYSGQCHRAAGDLGDPPSGASTVCDAASCIGCNWACDSAHAASALPLMAELELADNPSYLD